MMNVFADLATDDVFGAPIRNTLNELVFAIRPRSGSRIGATPLSSGGLRSIWGGPIEWLKLKFVDEELGDLCSPCLLTKSIVKNERAQAGA